MKFTLFFHRQADTNDNDDDDAPSIYDDDITAMIIQELGLIGEVTLVRFVNDTMWVTFRDGQSALIASRKKAIRIRGIDFLINLKTEDWVAHVEREIALCSSNTVQLCTTPGMAILSFKVVLILYGADTPSGNLSLITTDFILYS